MMIERAHWIPADGSEFKALSVWRKALSTSTCNTDATDLHQVTTSPFGSHFKSGCLWVRIDSQRSVSVHEIVV